MPVSRLASSCLTALAMLSPAAHAATFTVTSSADAGAGSLRAAMAAAYATAGSSHTIEFALPADSVIQLDSTLPAGSGRALVLDASASSGLVIDGQGLHRLFSLGSASALTLRNMTLRDGFAAAAGGCIHTEFGNSPIVLQQVQVRGCTAVSNGAPARGGAIRSHGKLFIHDSTFVDNRVESDSGVALGGAVYVQNQLWIENSHFQSNRAIGSAGAISSGGALAGGTPLTVLRSRFIDNRAEHAASLIASSGGAIYARNDATATVRQSLFAGNVAGDGAAVLAMATSANTAMQVTLGNCTFAGNQGGPALVLAEARINARNNSFWRNQGAAAAGAHLELRGVNTVIDAFANNLLAASADGGALCSFNAVAELVGSGHNLFADASCAGLDAGSVVDTGDLRIRGLRVVGAAAASLPVIDLFAGSPALDAGDPTPPGDPTSGACTAGDALDQDRPADADADGNARCDIGAHELQHEASLFADDFEPMLLH